MTTKPDKTFDISVIRDSNVLGWFYLQAEEQYRHDFIMRTDSAPIDEQWKSMGALIGADGMVGVIIENAKNKLKTQQSAYLGAYTVTTLQMTEAGFNLHKEDDWIQG
jgi:hypothetical protein